MTDAILPCMLDEKGNYQFSRSVTVGELVTIACTILNDRSLEVVFAPDLDPERKVFLEDLTMLLEYGERSETHGTQCAMFLLSLWNGNLFKIDLQELVFVNREIHTTMLRVLRYLHQHKCFITDFIDEEQMRPMLYCLSSAYTQTRQKSN